VEKYTNVHVYVHPNAAILTDEDRFEETIGTIAEVAGTRSGTGAALARKIMRDPKVIAANSLGEISKTGVTILNHRLKPDQRAYFMEVSQGFSLGINSQFYPKVTSRECTVMQGLADARIPASALAKTYMAIRTYPIRVGNVDGHSSGNWYEDQDEVTWEQIGVPEERTTVTNRVRRVATFSMDQLYEACYANDPDYLFISHMDYLQEDWRQDFLRDINEARHNMRKYFKVLLGFGPNVGDILGEEEWSDHYKYDRT
jgi:adenylosuccinate synthase